MRSRSEWILEAQFGEHGEISVPAHELIDPVRDADRCDTCIVYDTPDNVWASHEPFQ